MNERFKNHQKKIQKKNTFKTMSLKDIDLHAKKLHDKVMELTAREMK